MSDLVPGVYYTPNTNQILIINWLLEDSAHIALEKTSGIISRKDKLFKDLCEKCVYIGKYLGE